MPPIRTRLSSQNPGLRFSSPTPRPIPSPPVHSTLSLSLHGNPAPTRGLLPVELTYDFYQQHFNPDGPNFTRGLADLSNTIRNTALQALANSGVKIN
jgi:hypothetical protein